MKFHCALIAGMGVLALTGSAFANSASADPAGWYLGVGAGWTSMDGTAAFRGIGQLPLSYDSNARLSAAFGYKWPEGWRAEIEPTWVTNDADISGMKGGATMGGALGNILYDYDLGDSWKLTAGLGAGAMRVSHNIRWTASNTLFVGGNGVGFAWQAIGGISYAPRYDWDIGLDYRYMDTGDTGAVSQIAPLHFQAGKAQTLMVSVRWYPLARQAHAVPPPASMPPPPRPIPPPPPPLSAVTAPLPPPPVKTFLIFFDFNRSDLTDQAHKVVAEAVAAAKQQGAVRVVVTGHTDTVGSGGYNQKLSERRAAAVKSAMTGLGTPAGEITTAGKGFSEPRVVTGAGVREPQNRRVTIDLGQ